MGRQDQIINERLRKIKELKQKGINPYPHKYEVKNTAKELQEKHKKLKPDSASSSKVRLAGRLLTIRDMGKISFGNLQDGSGKIQITLQKTKTPEKQIEFFKNYVDVGDFIGVEGTILRTKRGELSILCKDITILSKSVLPLPEKWHGLQDKEERYRKRYLDLIMNPDVKETFEKRTKIISSMRNFLSDKGFAEVETPLLQSLYGGAEAEPFVTRLNALKMDLYLSISPEMHLKRLLIGGIDKIFTICKNFRNEGIDKSHNPEFTMMEAYASYWDYKDVMKLTEEMLEAIAIKVTGKVKIKYQGKELNFKGPYRKLRIKDAIKKYADIDPSNEQELKKYAKRIGFSGTNDEIINEIFEEEVEKNLVQPTFILDYPKSICPLTKEHRKNNDEVERFELFVNGMELANAYSELNDPIEQEDRLNEQVEKRKKSSKHEAHSWANELDEDFIEAMKHGMPPAGGIGVGVDRLVLFLTDSPSIRDVILFPFMK